MSDITLHALTESLSNPAPGRKLKRGRWFESATIEPGVYTVFRGTPAEAASFLARRGRRLDEAAWYIEQIDFKASSVSIVISDAHTAPAIGIAAVEIGGLIDAKTTRYTAYWRLLEDLVSRLSNDQARKALFDSLQANGGAERIAKTLAGGAQ